MRPSRERLCELVDALAGRRVAVLADLVADEYLLCRTDRISREAPAALILRFENREIRPGGGANAVANLRALGAEVRAVGVVGSDAVGHELREALIAGKVDSSGILVEDGFRTVVKSRVLTSYHHSTKQQVLRIDHEDRVKPGSAVEKAILARIRERCDGVDALLISDYGYGAAAPAIARIVAEPLRRQGVTTTVDSRYRILEHKGIGAATPNEPEVESALEIPIGDDTAALERAGKVLLERLRADSVVITRGSRGMSLFEADGAIAHVPVHGSDEIADVTGAGDTVIAVFTLARASGASWIEAAHLANIAGGVVVMKMGTTTVDCDELRASLRTW